MIAKQNAGEFKQNYEELKNALHKNICQDFNCPFKNNPVIYRAINQPKQIGMGVKAPFVVDNLRREKLNAEDEVQTLQEKTKEFERMLHEY